MLSLKNVSYYVKLSYKVPGSPPEIPVLRKWPGIGAPCRGERVVVSAVIAAESDVTRSSGVVES